jgi:hypothetical protein
MYIPLQLPSPPVEPSLLEVIIIFTLVLWLLYALGAASYLFKEYVLSTSVQHELRTDSRSEQPENSTYIIQIDGEKVELTEEQYRGLEKVLYAVIKPADSPGEVGNVNKEGQDDE